MTKSEKLLWDFFIADFYCHEARLVVEIDGESHNQQKEYDDGRSAEMEKYYIKTIRFSNYEVENSIEKVIIEIKTTVNECLKSPSWGI